jgi:ABC-type phosphate transport system substrate-binding protein
MKSLIFTLFFFVFTSTALCQIAVIANKNVPVDSVSRGELLDYYSGEIREWTNKKPITVFDLKPRLEIREKFFEYLGKSSSRMRSIWLKKLLSGEGDPPAALENELKVLSTVANTPGSIGFINTKLIDNSVKVLRLIE